MPSHRPPHDLGRGLVVYREGEKDVGEGQRHRQTRAGAGAPPSISPPLLLFIFASYLDTWPGSDRHGGPQRRRTRKDSTCGKHACCLPVCCVGGEEGEKRRVRSSCAFSSFSSFVTLVLAVETTARGHPSLLTNASS